MLRSFAQESESAMAADAQWIEDVRRWYLAGQQGSTSSVVTDGPDSIADAEALGYEAADPALQSRHWPDAPAGNLEPGHVPAR